MTLNKDITQNDIEAAFARLPPVTDEMLEDAFLKAHQTPMSLHDRMEQMVSFVWGNALESDRGTIKSVREHLNLQDL
jgi:hypothetical protein